MSYREGPEPTRYLWWTLWIFPNPRRELPRYRREWIRPVLAVVLVITWASVYLAREPLQRMATCNRFPDTTAWSVDDRCVGLSEGPYAFGVDAFTQVMQVIHQQNQAAATDCAEAGTPATVGVLLTMTDPFAGTRAVHELQGMAAGQRAANTAVDCLHPMKLVVGQLGDYRSPEGPVAVAQEMAEQEDVVAVAGVGQSHQITADIVDLLAAAEIPMVADVVTAEGFDQTGSRSDDPDFSSCDTDVTYHDGIGRDYYYRVSFRVGEQIRKIREMVPGKPEFIMVPIGGSDPYTCTALPLLQRAYAEHPDDHIAEVQFDTANPSTIRHTVDRVCNTTGPVTIAYIARARDLGRLLHSLDEALRAGHCSASEVTVVSTSDAGRLRSVESEDPLEDVRVQALTSENFTSGKIRLMFPQIHGDVQLGNSDFENALRAVGLDPAEIGDGWAVSAYDALATISAALDGLPENEPVTRSDINAAISGFTDEKNPVPGAGGPIYFEKNRSGNRAGAGPSVVELCPLPPTPNDRSALAGIEPVATPAEKPCPR